MSTYSRSCVGPASDGPLTAIGGIVLLVNVVGLFAFTGLALAIFGYIGITILLIWLAGRNSARTKAFRGAEAAMVCSWFAALATGVLVGALHWVKFPHAAYATLGLYSLAAAIWICGRAISFLSAFWFTSFAAALWAAVICLPAPPGSEDPSDRENRT